MSPAEIVSRLEALGAELIADGDKLRVRALPGQLSDELKQAIAARKTELLEFLAQRRSASARPQRHPRTGPLPLSYFQERLWVMQRLEPNSTAYNLVTAWTFEEPALDVERLVGAVVALLRRHEILHATFREVDGIPQMVIADPETVVVPRRDIRGLTSDEQSQLVRDEADRAVHTPFDLQNEVAIRCLVFWLASDRAVVLLSAHHIAVDAWSLDLLGRELRDTYRSGPGVTAGALRAEALEYADFAALQRQSGARGLGTDLEWWASAIAGVPQLSMFPPDYQGGAQPTGGVHELILDTPLSNAFRTLAREQGATVYMAMVAACGAVLHKHTNQSDMVFGSPMGVRERPEFEPMIGPFVNLLMIRVKVQDDPSFGELLAHVRRSMLDAYDHRDVPFEKIIERVKPARSFQHSPLFQIAIVQHNATVDARAAVGGGGALYELSLFIREIDGQLRCAFEYRSDLYAAESIHRIGRHLETLLRAVVAEPARPISQLRMLADDEWSRVVSAFNATERPLPASTMVAQFERRVEQSPDAVALVFESESLTYAELNRRAHRLAHRLRSLGVAPGNLVAVAVPRSPALLVALLATHKAGGAYVPLDPGFPADRLTYMLADSEARVLVTAGDASDGIEVTDGVQVLNLDNEEAAPVVSSERNLAGGGKPADPAYVIYTSGSTGRPKGVVVGQGALLNFLLSMAEEPGLSPSDVLAAVTTISFDIAALELYLPLLIGARIELVSRETAADGVALAGLLGERGVTVLQATPATWRLLLETDWQPAPGFRALCGGEPLPRDVADALLDRVGELWNLYGPTETTVWSTVERVDRGPITVGRPIANTQIYVVDAAGEPVPVGVAGEIWIGGDGVAIGYHRRPELTAEKFVIDRFRPRPDARLYRTGDLGRWRNDGRLEHLGRLDHQVKIRGFRIELGEIETVLAGHEAIRQAVVVAREAGAGDMRLVAYVVYAHGQDLTVSEVRRHLRQTLPDYMVPAAVIAMDAVPLTPNGKVDRAALPDPFKTTQRSAESFEPPAPGTEQALAEIWRDVLKVERVGAEDNFFELGGHSLLSLRVASEVEKRMGWQMDPRALFFQTLRQLAGACDAALAGSQAAAR